MMSLAHLCRKLWPWQLGVASKLYLLAALNT
jgi:hypothetical protein